MSRDITAHSGNPKVHYNKMLGGLCSLIFINEKFPDIKETITTSVTGPYR